MFAYPMSASIAELVHEKSVEILTQHQPSPLPATVEAELERIVRRYLGPDFHFEP